MTKQDVLKVIEALPDDVSPDVILEEIRFRLRTEQAIASLEAGKGIPHEEAERRIDQWLHEE